MFKRLYACTRATSDERGSCQRIRTEIIASMDGVEASEEKKNL